jgi:hypothetical protein
MKASARRGNKQAVITQVGEKRKASLVSHPAFGMWKDRTDMKDVSAFVRRLRRGRFGEL